jgi:hypothetical protein
MPEKRKPRRLNTIPVGDHYLIENMNAKGEVSTETVEEYEIAYDVFGIRKDENRVAIDHIPTGWKIAAVKNEREARLVIAELVRVSNFRWIQPPKSIRAAVKAILESHPI